ncbi:hypothetical protein [Candidatus Soleaferrea massiliensis]|uniref:Ppx/GppA phosphatase family protein n=1 Tax=Candidatus Soleaferrea massiliensis TaxID=1470354 RepID=UPI00058F1546|nr:hypothetical protein [Candidatus Soleaferrea massiliensis]
MLCGVIDVGSNSIRMSIYRCAGNDFQILMNQKTVAGLASYVTDNRINSFGIRKACEVLEEYMRILKGFGVETCRAFATASLRNVQNREEALRELKERLGVEVEILSGDEEARLGFVGMQHQMQAKEGIMADIGGASTELLYFEDGKVLYKESLPVGSLSLYSGFVKAIFPIDVEKKAIKRAIDEQLSRVMWFSRLKTQHLYGIGGTFRSAQKLALQILPEDLPADTIPTDVIRHLLKNYHHIDKKMCHELLQVMPERIHTILPGLMILEAVARKFKCVDFSVSSYGVREGYLISNLLKQGNHDEQ